MKFPKLFISTLSTIDNLIMGARRLSDRAALRFIGNQKKKNTKP
jgi:hypothetical protein